MSEAEFRLGIRLFLLGDDMSKEEMRRLREERRAAGDVPEIPETEDTPDWGNPSDVLKWWGQKLISLSKRKENLPRLRALSSAVDTWTRLSSHAESSDLQTIRREFESLKKEIEIARRRGPEGIVK